MQEKDRLAALKKQKAECIKMMGNIDQSLATINGLLEKPITQEVGQLNRQPLIDNAASLKMLKNQMNAFVHHNGLYCTGFELTQAKLDLAKKQEKHLQKSIKVMENPPA